MDKNCDSTGAENAIVCSQSVKASLESMPRMCVIVSCFQVSTYLSANSAFFFLKSVLQVGDFGDANSWPTPGEIATKDMQVGVYFRSSA